MAFDARLSIVMIEKNRDDRGSVLSVLYCEGSIIFIAQQQSDIRCS